MTPRHCDGTTKAGTACRAHPLKGRDTCIAHADKKTQDSTGFGGAQPGAGRKPLPKPADLARELVEQHVAAILRPHFKALGLMVNDDGSVTQLDHGAIYVGRDKEGGVHASTIEDLGAQIAAARELLDRVYGKPRQALEHTGADGGPIELDDGHSWDLSKLSDEQLEQLQELMGHAAPERG